MSGVALSGGLSQEEKEVGSTLVMITAADNPPFEYYNTEQGANEVIGYDVELAQKIAEYLGYKLEIKDVDFPGIIPGLMHGRADFAMASLYPTAERKKSVDFSDSYYSPRDVMVTKVDSDFADLTDYEGKIIGVQMGSAHEQIAQAWVAVHPGSTVKALNKIGDIIQEVLSGRIHGAIMDETVADAHVKNHNRSLTATPVEKNSANEGPAIAFPKDSQLRGKFNEALQKLRETGFMDELAQKWLKK